MMTLMDHYEAAIYRGEIDDDPLQRELLGQMQRLANDLEQASASWFYYLYKPKIKGVYIYGPVGAGKTYFVDLFYVHINECKKARFHFHHANAFVLFLSRHDYGGPHRAPESSVSR